MKRDYSDTELAEMLRTVRAARVAPRGPLLARVLFIFAAIGPVVMLGFNIMMMLRTPTAAVQYGFVMMGSTIVFAASYYWCVLVRRRFKRDVLARDGKVCPNCHYDLRQVDAGDAVAFCPECREPYRIAELHRLWSGWSPGMVWWD